ncbi:hypothetical protein [Oligoflexus tunisiensis]|uniref:hypothetical protein n=1 Tax=Oligoflexus tunisiensis TaxID=708132 RepID=UPI001C404A46|nr:hypothetical protein [Oligoflexus tunisiensis]
MNQVPTLPEELQHGDFLAGSMNSPYNLPTEQIGYQEVYFAFIDVLGYRSLLMKHRDEAPRIIFQIMRQVHDFCSTTYKQIRMKILSDSILVWSENSSVVHIWSVLNVIELIRNQFLKNGLFLRGAVAKGKSFVHQDIIVSPALSRAYELESKICKVPRILIDDGLQKLACADLRRDPGGAEFLFWKGVALICNSWIFKRDFDDRVILHPFSGLEGYTVVQTGKPSSYVHGDKIPDTETMAKMRAEGIGSLNAFRGQIIQNMEKSRNNIEVYEKFRYLAQKFDEVLSERAIPPSELQKILD